MGGADYKRIGAGIMTGGASEGMRNLRGNGMVQEYGGKAGLGGGKGGGGPEAPDFGAAAAEQARLSRNDVNSTFGSARWSQGPDGRWTMNSSMSPELQAQVDRLTGSLGNQMDPQATRDQAIDSAYRMQTSRLDPRFAQAQSSLETQLANEGFSRGDAGWNTAMGNFSRDRNDAYQQALLGAQSGAGNTAFGQALAANMQPYQQLGAIKGLGEGMASQALAGAQPPETLAAAMQKYGGDLQKYGIDQQSKNSKMNGGARALALL